jgi:hypothetical protein
MKLLRYSETSTIRPKTNSHIPADTDLQQRAVKTSNLAIRHVCDRVPSVQLSKPLTDGNINIRAIRVSQTLKHLRGDVILLTSAAHLTSEKNKIAISCSPSDRGDAKHADKLHGIPWWRNAESDVNKWFPECGPRIARGDPWMHFRNGYFEVHLSLN